MCGSVVSRTDVGVTYRAASKVVNRQGSEESSRAATLAPVDTYWPV